MIRLACLIVILAFLIGCSGPRQPERPKLTGEQKTKIESYSNKLVKSINDFEFSIITDSWSDDAFKSRISNQVNKTQQSVLTHIFEKDLRMMIKTGNLGIIHRVNADQGRVSLMRLDHFDTYSELILLMTFEGIYDFFKYRIEFISNKPKLTDFYSYTDNLWYSEKIIETLRLNSKYGAFSDERNQANRAIQASDEALTYGDTLEALNYLYDIPKTHEGGNWLSLKKINLAVALNDTVLADVMATEHHNNKSLYMEYLYNYFIDDSVSLNATYELLSKELGESEALDSLIKKGYLWNLDNNDNNR